MTTKSITVNDVVTGLNTGGILYLWYDMQKIGAELTAKIRDTISLAKIINSNVNILTQHFMNHLIRHKTFLDVEDDNHVTISTDDFNMLIRRIEALESEIVVLKQNSERKDTNDID